MKLKNKNKIKNVLIFILQLSVVFSPILYLFTKYSDSEFYKIAWKNSLNTLIGIIVFVSVFLIFVTFRNSILHLGFYVMSFSLIWYYVYNLLGSFSYLLKSDRKLDFNYL